MKQVCLTGFFLGIVALGAPPTVTSVTFNKDVLPILQKNCQSCHRPGEIAPMSLLSYKDARPWAKAMKDAVLARKMPPWFADQKSSTHFSNARGLTDAQINTMVSWVDAGAPEGDAKDRPAPVQWPDGWMIKPDIVIEMAQAHEVPTTGLNENLYFIAKGKFDQDTWLEAAEVRPSNRALVHHMRVWIRPPGTNWLQGAEYGPAYELGWVAPGVPARQKGAQPAYVGSGPRPQQEILAKYNPGVEPQSFTLGGGAKFVPRGSDIVFEAHYTTIGKVASDQSKIGLKIAKAPPKIRYVTIQTLGGSRINIPPGDSNYEVQNTGTLDQDTTITWMQPHMHLRGKDYMLTAYYPSGESEVILKTGYDFNWQLGYEFAKPLLLPKGTKLVTVSHYDNSTNNKYNPDPTATVHFGVQSSDEMNLTYLGVLMDPKADPQKVFARVTTNKAAD
jgi:hypothetical protein